MHLSFSRAAALLAALLLAASAHAQYQERTLRVSNTPSSDHPVKDGLDAMHACTLEQSGGKMRLRAFWDSALGGDTSATQSVRTGNIEMVLPSTAPLTTIVPALGILDLPFLFNTPQEADQLLDGPVGDWFLAQLPPVGLVGLAWWENGFRHATNSRRPITRLEDFAGLKMRVMQSPVALDTFKTLGANAVPMALSEVYPALETRTVDGQENPLAVIRAMKFHEVQKYLTLSKHTYAPLILLISKKTWDALSDAERGTLQDCARIGRDVQRRVSRERENRDLAHLRTAGGMQVNDIAPQEMQRIREHTRAVHQRTISTVGQDVADRVNAELARIRGE